MIDDMNHILFAVGLDLVALGLITVIIAVTLMGCVEERDRADADTSGAWCQDDTECGELTCHENVCLRPCDGKCSDGYECREWFCRGTR